MAGQAAAPVSRSAGCHQNCGAGTDGAGPHQSDIPAEAGVDVSGRAGGVSAVCPGVGAESVPSAHIRQSAVNRLWGWAVIAQFAYYVAGLPWYQGNILFAFAVAAQVLRWCENLSLLCSLGAVILIVAWIPLSQTCYGVPGLLLLAVSYRLYRADDLTERMVLSVCLVPAILAQNLITSEVAALAGLLVTGVTIWLVSLTGRTLPRFWPGDFFPVFYILHLTVLGILAL